MDVGTVMSVAQTFLAALECTQLKEICSTAGYKTQLDELRHTVNRIKAVLQDAEAKQELSAQEQLYIEDLKDAVYEADDLFDEFVTLARQKKLTKGIKVRVLSLFGKFGRAYNMAQGVKKIKKKLDAIVYNKQFDFKIDQEPIRNRRQETCSYEYEADIIGREKDVEKIVSELLDSNVQKNVSFLPIVGIGGLGKTALAQLIFNNARVTTAFPLRLWACVADENQKQLDIEGVLRKILASTPGGKTYGDSMQELQSELRGKLAGNKYLLVLDDVWTEDCYQWRELTKVLMGGQSGSWVVVTTRSWKTATIAGDGPRHELQGLSKEDSWRLFEKVAFGSRHPPEDLVKIGEEIVESCANVPLAIRVVGSLLYGQDKQKWLSIQKQGFAKVEEGQNNIMPILKLSYYQLESRLKSCFSYCAIFPKDFEMDKKTLICLWLAQSYITFSDAEECFSILLRRCFFQDVKKDYFDDIYSFKLHDLMHDVAQEVMGKEISRVHTINEDVDGIIVNNSANFSFTETRIRSCLFIGGWDFDHLSLDALLSNWKYLRALSLSHSNLKRLPSSIGELLHLRYLDLSHNDNLEVLPQSITSLCNLQTLCLNDCKKLKVLPRGMGKLTLLHTLPIFVVNRNNLFDGLKDLHALKNLTYFLKIKIHFQKNGANVDKKDSGKEGGFLFKKPHLISVHFEFVGEEDEERVEFDEAVMKKLQPHHNNVERLVIREYQGVRMPLWAREGNLTTFLPNLVHLQFNYCPRLQLEAQLRLPQLKSLSVWDCPNLIGVLECSLLEGIYIGKCNRRLEIIKPKRRIKCKEIGEATATDIPSSSYDIGPESMDVYIDDITWLNSFHMNPFEDGLVLKIVHDRKTESLGEAREWFRSCSSSLRSLSIFGCKLRSVVSGGLEYLTALKHLTIKHCEELSLSEEEEEREYGLDMPWQPSHFSLCSLNLTGFPKMVELPNWIQYLTTLQTLHIQYCNALESLPHWMSKLTSLKKLELKWCSESLNERCQESTGEDWPHIQHIPSIEIIRYKTEVYQVVLPRSVS